MVVNSTTSSFDADTASGIVLVDFYAPWCGPCKTISPLVDAIANEYSGRAAVVKVDIDDNFDLAARFNIRSVPSFVVMRDGVVKQTVSGVTTKAKLTSLIDAAVAG